MMEKPAAGEHVKDPGAIFKSKALIHTHPFAKLIFTHVPLMSSERTDVIKGR